jgi:hypothetical protein
VKRPQENKILLYEDRSRAQCIEAVFDFMRANRRIWFRSAFTLLMPVCMVLGFSVLTLSADDRPSGDTIMDWLFVWGPGFDLFFKVMVVVGTWMTFVHVYSLLEAYDEHGSALDAFTQRQMLPYYLRKAKVSWWLAILLAGVSYFVLGSSNIWPSLLLLIVLVPLALLPSVVIIERLGVFTAFAKSLRLGFQAWFQLFFTIGLTLLFGFLMTLVIALPSLVMSGWFSSLAYGLSSNNGLTLLVAYGFTSLVYLGLYLMVSMMLMSCAYEYGTVSERIDDASLESEIEHFEDL